MSNLNNSIPENQPEVEKLAINEEEMRLDDARRVKVLSPGMLVFKRFIRNKLAVIGLVILVFMFLFSFAGPLFSPYEQAQVFTNIGTMTKDYAGAIYNREYRYTVVDGETFGSAERSQFLLTLGKNGDVFSVGDVTYYITAILDNAYRIVELDPVAEVFLGRVNPVGGNTLPSGFVDAFESASEQGEDSFVLENVRYRITSKLKAQVISTEHDVALAVLSISDAYNAEDVPIVDSFDFKLAIELAIADNQSAFIFNNQVFSLSYDEGQITIYDSGSDEFAAVSDIIVNPRDKDEFLSVEYKSAIREVIRNNQSRFMFTYENGETIEYFIERINLNYYIKRATPTELISIFEAPSRNHLLGLDNNGMDVMTRLMYGGRISLLVGFVVILIEFGIGVIIGGISGYFGGKVDTALMRFVDLFNSIPFFPIVIIFGSVMDTLKVDPMGRIYLLMAVLGILGWTSVARVVRGQILSLREQDFMVATEATGIRTSRRIFKHLVPNVMPLLIVQATAGLGGIIISEATLGFLGLGVKYPLASWGSIINVSSDAYVMTNFWFMWIPAGLLILVTVLGFNFVGDGLRDAFDPKMKR
jgi:peptide/nickel transport system permease protein